jgi:alkylhydroperoxidase family enzyme
VSHAGFLRQFWGGPQAEVVTLVQGLSALADRLDSIAPKDMMAHVDARLPELLDGADLAIVRVVARLCVRPRSMTAAHLQPLRDAGLGDVGIHDVVQVVACFSYMNRLADGLGVGIEARKRPWAVELFGEDAIEAHLAWANG